MAKNTKTRLELIKPKLCYEAMCVYKFTLDTGFYYIGGTTNLGERICDHLKFYRDGIQTKVITKAMDEAKTITFEFLRFVNNKEDLGKQEQSFLERNVGLPFCLNIQNDIRTTYIRKEALHKTARVVNGVIDKIYKSVAEAALDNGINIRTIVNNCSAKYPRDKVYYRRLDQDGNIITPAHPLRDNILGEKKIRQYDLNLIFINEFKSMSEAARRTGLNRREIGKTANGVQRTAKGFVFRMVDKDGNDIIPMFKSTRKIKNTA